MFTLTSDNSMAAMKPPGSWTTVYGFAAIGLLILLVACFNFMNLATARAMMRAREIALRKAVGATRRQLIIQFLGEAVIDGAAGAGCRARSGGNAAADLRQFLDRPITFDYLPTGHCSWR